MFQVERILDRRRTRKGKVEYLVRWRGYGSEGDTWEPETHLSTCLSYVHHFNRQYAQRQRDCTLLRSTRSPAHSPAHRLPPADFGGDVPTEASETPLSLVQPPPQRSPPADGFGSGATSLAGPARHSVDLSKTGIKILVPKSPMNGRLDAEASPSEAAHSLEEVESHLDPPEVALLEKPAIQLEPGEERARMGTRPRNPLIRPQAPPLVPVTPTAVRSLSSSGEERMSEDLGFLSA